MNIRINGHSMHYELTGPAKAPVVALSHSLASSTVMWEPQAAALEKSFRLLRYDTRGHGESEATPAPYSFELLAADFAGLLDALGIGRARFVGLSMGGMIGQALGILHPDRLEGLCLCDTSSRTTSEGAKAWRDRLAVVRKEGLAAQAEPTLGRWFTEGFLKANPPIVRRIREQFLRTPVEGYAGCAEAIIGLDFQDRLQAIRVPTLVVVGEEDPGTPVAAARAIQERIPGAKLEIIPGGRHLPNAEKPEAFNAALLGFLTGL